ncbi:MAG: RES family NAD+ phosphorylase [Acidobacteriota bacterium]
MSTLWRISNHLDLRGLGGTHFASRWTTLGRRVVFMAESPAGALLEVLVHLNEREDRLPRTFALLEIDAPDELASRDLMPLAGVHWRDRTDVTQKLGDEWLASLESPLARVPSAIVPRTWNLLLNPLHRDAEKLRIVSVIRERFDTRLFTGGPR